MNGLSGPATLSDERGFWPRFTHARVGAFMSTRVGGVSADRFESFNLRFGVGDDDRAVAANRTRLAALTGVPSVRLDQVHGAAVHLICAEGAGSVRAPDAAALPVADASVTTRFGLACEIQVADCLPVLFADVDGRVVAAAHAGWRGLAGGVLEACLAGMVEQGGVSLDSIEAWLGPCIGPERFEVGLDVLAAFGAQAQAASQCFSPQVDAQGALRAGKWRADLAGLARQRLRQAGVHRLGGNDSSAAWCTASDGSRFFSYRRDAQTGRMAALVWLNDVGR